ncbi:MAG TPA: hypothetical protein VN956_11860 [Pyrinomonadaceae bacterium]|nr:hypothetical protein [Pyrinomonadaceae bacterium]
MKIFSARNIGGSILGLLLLLGTMMVSGTTTQAQYQYPYPNQDQYRRQRERDRQAEIQRQAEIERQRQQRNGQWGNGQYDNGQWNNGQWNRQGRRGRNSDGYPNYGGSYELRQTALNAGYNEGNRAGRNDRRSGRYDPTRSNAYRNALKDYNSRMGDRYAYQQYFRAAFENGYSDGYNGY